MLAVIGVLCAIGCATPSQRIDRDAQRAGLERSIAQGTTFRHVVYVQRETRASSHSTLTVYLEGDGIPWLGGRVPASDPTTREPLALHLMLQSSGPSLYVSRPCYQELRDPSCSAQLWTFGRYSTAIIDSMVKVIEAKASELEMQSIQLIGYSGGGVLAVLIAERLHNVRAVVTVAANLDVAAWAEYHGYLPLNDSLNPALSARHHPWQELHLQGALDKTVPIATTHKYFERFGAAKRLTFENYNHVCCWSQEWGDVQERIRSELR